MKKSLWIVALVALVSFVAAQGVMAKEKAAGEKHARPAPVEVKGKVSVDGDTVKITTADNVEYTVMGAGCADLKAKAGTEVEVKGIVKEKDGKKMLVVGGMHHKKDKAPAK